MAIRRKTAVRLIIVLCILVAIVMFLEWLFPSFATFMLPLNLAIGVIIGSVIQLLRKKKK